MSQEDGQFWPPRELEVFHGKQGRPVLASLKSIGVYMSDPILAPFQFRQWLSSSGTGPPMFPNWPHTKMGHPVLELDDPVPGLGSA